MREIRTKRNYLLSDVASAFQKAIRRADLPLSGYWAIELFESGFAGYLWRRMTVISAEDCWGILTQEIVALQKAWSEADKKRKGSGRIFISKAVILICLAKKNRDADHLTNLVYDRQSIPAQELITSLESSRGEIVEIPDYAYDCHTRKGRQDGKTKENFFVDEFEALKPRQQGLFDSEVNKLKK